MLLAEKVFKKAITVRDDRTVYTGEFQKLESAVRVWMDFCAVDETPIDMIVAVLESNETFRAELAQAVGWDQPKDSSMDLILLAVGAIQNGDEAKVGEVFAEIFGDDSKWKNFKDTHDRTILQTLLESNPLLRNKLSDKLDEYPGKRHLRELAAKVDHLLPKVVGGIQPTDEKAPFNVLKKYLLNWETFALDLSQQKAGSEVTTNDPATTGAQKIETPQESHLRAILQKDYQFRQAIAKAVGQPTGEAIELAHLAVEMWRAIPASSLIGDSRTKIIEKGERKNKIPTQLLAQKNKPSNADGWDGVEDSLAVTFACDPQTAVDLWEAMDWPYPFALVLREELRQIQARRQLFSPPAVRATEPEAQAGSSGVAGNASVGCNTPPGNLSSSTKGPHGPNPFKPSDASDLGAQMNLFGVAFSGGGIRSATFNLGVLQELSKYGLLSKVDYLSTVSGGGYIGSWLTGWIYKNRNPNPETLHDGLKTLLSPEVPDPRADPQRPVRFLREFSNYLTPKLGTFSFDTWTMAAVYSRNLFLNQATLISVLGFLLLLPRFMTFPLTWGISDWWMGVPAVLLVGIAVYSISVNIRSAVDPRPAAKGGVHAWACNHVQFSVIFPFLVAMYLGSVSIWRTEEFLHGHPKVLLCCALGIASFLSFLLLWRGGFIREFKGRQVGSAGWWAVLILIVGLSALAMTGLLKVDLAIIYALKNLGNAGTWTAVIFSPVMLLAVMAIPGTLQVGLMGVDFPDAGREWLSRFRAICTVYSMWWIAFLGAAIYGPWLVWTAAGHIVHWAAGITAGWIVTTIGGILAGKSKKTGTDREGRPKFSWLQILAKAAPPVFAAGLVLLIATGEQVLLAHGAGVDMDPGSLLCASWMTLDRHYMFGTCGWFVDQPGWLLLMLAAAGLILTWRVDINEFSMHHFYKNRLVRCYLGASNENRRPNEFTGFDAGDDTRLALLKAIPEEDKTSRPIARNTQASKSNVGETKRNTPYLGPYPIINTTLNLSTGEQLAWQERKGTSFILSPCFCGFDIQGWASSTAAKKKSPSALRPREELLPAGYRKTSSFTHMDGPYLGTSFSISGAAANPNQGYNTSPAVAFLMTMFNVRLGWWVGNPRRSTEWKQSSPTFGLVALLSELVGMTNDTAKFVNLSDGGHFDNMGLYELVRRRCSLILLCDAEQDPEFKFEGLGSAIRKCRIDFGAFIEIDTSLIRPDKDGKPSGTHCAVGTILYLDGSRGTLVYIKPSLTGDEPEDVTQYHQAHADFPHETTADQWFTESQFESYRELGYHATDQTLKPAGAWIDWKPEQPDVSGLIEALRNYWYPDNPNLKDNASRHTATLVRMLDSIRETAQLRDLGSKLFPGITVPPPGDVTATQEFYFGLSILQLVEDIYFDFKLDRPVWADDPRIGGWNNLFRIWKRVPEVAAAWASARETFRKDFQVFWEGL